MAEGQEGYVTLASRLARLMSKAPLLKSFTVRCLNSMRWGGSAVLMVVDAAITSAGLSYFTAVIPRVLRFKELFYDSNRVRSFEELVETDEAQLLEVWRLRRVWKTAKGVAAALLKYEGPDDRAKLRAWAQGSRLNGWRDDPVGSVSGVGLVTYQYLRMMGGVDTAMPDRVVKRFVAREAQKVGVHVPMDDYGFVKFLEELGRRTGIRPVEVTWLSWLIDSEGNRVLSERYRGVLDLI